MPLEEPGWWYGEGSGASWQARALRPLSRLYGSLAEHRMRRADPYRSRLPVICIGNFTAGGTGKTPLSLAVAGILAAAGEKPVFLTRGYRGRLVGPVWVEPAVHTAADTGDEPLLLARAFPSVVARDRKAGALFIERGERPASVIVMDDGLQNAALVKSLSIAVVDGARGVGNGEVFPAGPLRAPLAAQLSRTDCIVINGGSGGACGERLRRAFPGPVLSAAVVPEAGAAWLEGARIVAYAGIGNPARFFATLEGLGAAIQERMAFPDHHAFGEQDAERLLALARQRAALLVTTEKDLVRLGEASGRLGELARASRALAIRLDFSEPDRARLAGLIAGALGKVSRAMARD